MAKTSIQKHYSSQKAKKCLSPKLKEVKVKITTKEARDAKEISNP